MLPVYARIVGNITAEPERLSLGWLSTESGKEKSVIVRDKRGRKLVIERAESGSGFVEIEQEPVDVFTALDVLEKRKAECQGHALLFAALARAAGIPTRVVNGIVYSQAHEGFLYHTWAETLLRDRWVAVDPTFAQFPADATHIKLTEGDRPEDLTPLLGVIGRIQLRVVRLEYAE